MPFPIIVLVVVFLLIALRQMVHARLRIWQIMLGGAVAVLASGDISPAQALGAIDADVMLFLFGMFVVGRALEDSGYLGYLSYRLFSRARNLDQLLLIALFGMGMGSAFLMNDTLAIVGTPIMLLLAQQHGISAKPLLLALAFAVTTGSVMSPIGNPQNLLIAIHGGLDNPFVEFFRTLLLPSLINLGIVYGALRILCREHFHDNALVHASPSITDSGLARLCRLALMLIVLLVVLKIVLVFVAPQLNFRLTAIALAAALPILLMSPRRYAILRDIDWHTLIFFAALFVLMHAVWDSGVLQRLLAADGAALTSTAAVLAVSVLGSQLVSNVPLVALYLPVLLEAGASTSALLALAAGSTIAGNLFILGAASNVIVIHNAEMRGQGSVTFMEFARIGVPLTAVQVAVYGVFLELL